jgi:hypothetical protein
LPHAQQIIEVDTASLVCYRSYTIHLDSY